MADDNAEARLTLASEFKDELAAIVNKDKYSKLSIYTIIGAFEVLKSEVLELLDEDDEENEPWRESLKL